MGRLSVAALVLLLACTGSSTYTPRMEPPPAGAYGTLTHGGEEGRAARDPVRDELREILLPCQRRVERMRGSRYERRRRDTILMVLAQLLHTVFLSGFAGAQLAPTGSQCTGGTLDRGCALAPEQQFGVPFGGPSDDRAESVTVPERAIDGALETLDEILWSAPDPSDWDDEEREAYAQSRDNLVRLCEQLRRADAE